MTADSEKLGQYVTVLMQVMEACPLKGGTEGTMPCPVCKTGTIHYHRVANKRRHLRAACDTSHCFAVLE